jgi:site-specific DNA recombinase
LRISPSWSNSSISIWVGGPVPLGYRCIDKKVVVVPEEVDAVRSIFERYRR